MRTGPPTLGEAGAEFAPNLGCCVLSTHELRPVSSTLLPSLDLVLPGPRNGTKTRSLWPDKDLLLQYESSIRRRRGHTSALACLRLRSIPTDRLALVFSQSAPPDNGPAQFVPLAVADRLGLAAAVAAAATARQGKSSIGLLPRPRLGLTSAGLHGPSLPTGPRSGPRSPDSFGAYDSFDTPVVVVVQTHLVRQQPKVFSWDSCARS